MGVWVDDELEPSSSRRSRSAYRLPSGAMAERFSNMRAGMERSGGADGHGTRMWNDSPRALGNVVDGLRVLGHIYRARPPSYGPQSAVGSRTIMKQAKKKTRPYRSSSMPFKLSLQGTRWEEGGKRSQDPLKINSDQCLTHPCVTLAKHQMHMFFDIF